MMDVISSHIDALTDTVCLDLIYFSNKFTENGFITQTATNSVNWESATETKPASYSILLGKTIK